MQKKWCLFQATDFQTLMYPCFTSCSILGIFPYKINNSTFKTSKPRYILSITFICAICIFQVTFMNIDQLTSMYLFTKKDNFQFIIVYLKIISYNILVDSLAIATLLSSRSRMRLLQTITRISSKLPPETYQKLSRLIHTKDIIGFFCTISVISVYLYEKQVDTLAMIYSMYSCLVIFESDMMYMNCVCVLKACFKEINNKLLHIQEVVVNNESRVLTMVYYEQRYPFLTMKLKTLMKQHTIISNTVHMLNMNFSFQLAVSIFLTFIIITCDLYNNLVNWHNNEVVITLDQVWLSANILQIIKMASIVWACETCKKQTQEIRTTIHGVLNSTKEKKIKDELQLFSLQTLHSDNTFSMKFFNMDAKFLATMVGTITTYILILLQFLIMSHSCDGKSAINIT